MTGEEDQTRSASSSGSSVTRNYKAPPAFKEGECYDDWKLDIEIWKVGCALFSKFLGLNAVLVELDELSSGVPSFLKSDHGLLLRIAILCLVTWVSRGSCVMVS